jgi:hypothetical protein
MTRCVLRQLLPILLMFLFGVAAIDSETRGAGGEEWAEHTKKIPAQGGDKRGRWLAPGEFDY